MSEYKFPYNWKLADNYKDAKKNGLTYDSAYGEPNNCHYA